MITIILGVFVACVAMLLAYAATRPDQFRIERQITIQSEPEAIYPLIHNFHQWEAWSPWEKVDPQITRTYSGAAMGTGAIYEWSGNKDIGKGRMEIIEAMPSSKVTIKLDFIAPFEAHNTVEFTLIPQGATTLLIQAMYGLSPFISKLMGLVFNMEKMVGAKYEAGLSSIKALAEMK